MESYNQIVIITTISLVAPFLRVEYYNPSHQWRVKILLEKGFDMPMEQHPEQKMSSKGMESNVRQARYNGINGVNMGDGDSEVLKFCCYMKHTYPIQCSSSRYVYCSTLLCDTIHPIGIRASIQLRTDLILHHN